MINSAYSNLVHLSTLAVKRQRPVGDNTMVKIFQTINKLAKDLGVEKDGFRIITNCGRDSGQEVMHLHFHLLAGKKMGPKIVS